MSPYTGGATITIDGDWVNSVRGFVYLGSRDQYRDHPLATKSTNLRSRLWEQRCIRLVKKCKVYRVVCSEICICWSMLWNLHHNAVRIPSACQVCSAAICDTPCISRGKSIPIIQTFLSEQTCQVWKLCWQQQRDYDELGAHICRLDDCRLPKIKKTPCMVN